MANQEIKKQPQPEPIEGKQLFGGDLPEKSEPTPVEPPKSAQIPEEEQVVISKRTLDDILKRLDTVENSTSLKVTEEPTEEKPKPTATVRFVDGEVVIGYGSSYEEVGQGGTRHLIINVLTGGLDGTSSPKAHKLNYVDFRELGEKQTATIIEIKKKTVESKHGMVRVKKLEYDKFRAFESDKVVPVMVTGYEFTYTVKLDDGRVFQLPEQALN